MHWDPARRGGQGTSSLRGREVRLKRLLKAAGASNDMEHRTCDAVLSSIQAPTLIVHSREDKAVPFAEGEYSHENIPGSELREAPSRSHFISIGHGADQVDRKVVEFLKHNEW